MMLCVVYYVFAIQSQIQNRWVILHGKVKIPVAQTGIQHAGIKLFYLH